MTLDIIIKNGKVVGPHWIKNTDIGIKDGKITNIGNLIANEKADKIIDASGKIVIPGGIDPHTHIEIFFMGAQVSEDWTKATSAAAIGGTTTVLDFAGLEKLQPGDDLLSVTDKKLARAKEMSIVDYSVKPMLNNMFYKTIEDLKLKIHNLVSKGIPGFKAFMAYRELGIYSDDKSLYQIMKITKEEKVILQIHAENGLIEEANREELISQGKKDAIYHYYSKPNYVENLAISTAMQLAEVTKANTYIVHQTTKEGIDIISTYRKKGLNVFDETCPHYLILNKKYLEDKKRGRYFICSPPLREKEDVEALWNGLRNGQIQTIGSDHVAYSISQKEAFEEFTKVPNGLPGIELMVPLIFSEGVKKGRLSLQRFVDVISTNSAKIFGLYPKKGTIQIGSDADIVIIDPNMQHKLRAEDLHMGTDLSVYEDFISEGWPTHTIIRGILVAENEQILVKPGFGKFVLSQQEFTDLSTVW
ncbi:MAG: dihydropyrimidinase [Caldisphaera sp.]